MKTYLILLLLKEIIGKMYGSCKPENQSYELTSILKYEDDKITSIPTEKDKKQYVKFN